MFGVTSSFCLLFLSIPAVCGGRVNGNMDLGSRRHIEEDLFFFRKAD